MAVGGPARAIIDTATESDYGSDLDNDAWDAVFSQPESQQQEPTATSPNIKIEEEVVEEAVIPDDAEPQTHSLRLARIRENLEAAIRDLDGVASELGKRHCKVEIKYNEEDRREYLTGE